MTDEEKAIATSIAESAFPIFLAREINAGDGGKYASDDGSYAAGNAWTVAEMFMKERRKYIEAETAKDMIPQNPNVLTTEEQSLIKSGQKIQAIKEIRTRTGCGLVPAKDAVDRYADTLNEVPF